MPNLLKYFVNFPVIESELVNQNEMFIAVYYFGFLLAGVVQPLNMLLTVGEIANYSASRIKTSLLWGK